ncbi:bifunctional nuclease family protein [Propioniciclava coleopterorum]|uniref:Bifunctional nuclease family protein n=1 Tax=Propioniciclava coleopterorum TaxID=2714937 RepID=A0A6G7Y9J9_9ACTN|nr:bifunctional nuclease family protein [Propioniciclava coleopterorum]QIK73450.1 bifunctional nuclease family protein [Propioniciclava coleopterorum]
MIPMIFSEVRVTAVADSPLLLLREARGERYLPIWISAAGANSILSALEDAPDDNPGTHDFIIEALAALDAVVTEVHILDIVEGVYTAAAVVSGHTVPCRASDGVALALRCGATVLAREEVLDKAGTTVAADVPEASLGGGSDEQMEQFRAFLDTINPEDFEAGPAGDGDEQP